MRAEPLIDVAFAPSRRAPGGGPAEGSTGRTSALAVGIAAGLLLTAALPPFGWWPLAVGGAAVLAHALRGAPLRRRVEVGVATGLGLLAPGLFWMSEFSVPGYALAVLIEVTLLATGIAVVPPGRGRLLGLPAAIVLAESVRGIVPFGGVPIATFAQTQIGGPLSTAARAGGPLVVAALVAVAGTALFALATRAVRTAAVATAVVVAGVVAGLVAPDGRPVGPIDVAIVQGGGQRGLLASDSGDAEVLAAHLTTSEALPEGLDLVLWPENVVTVKRPVATTRQARQLGDVSRAVGATVVAGVVEREGDRFRNAAVAWGPDGEQIARYEKNQRVPFGEYVPMRGLISSVADVGAIPRDAIAGTDAGLLPTPVGDLGVVISYEVFFPRRARDAMAGGAEVLLVPTNASSFTTSQMPTLELGAARMRAIETGRTVLQAAPTGLSAVIRPDGTVVEQSDLGARQILLATVDRRAGRTPYTRLGDGPFVVAATVGLAVAWAREGGVARRSARGRREVPAVGAERAPGPTPVAGRRRRRSGRSGTRAAT